MNLKLSFLPNAVLEALQKVPFCDIYELRFRLNKPILVNLKNEYYFIEENSLKKTSNLPLFATRQMIESVLFKATNGSLYAYSEQIKQGFFTTFNGVRIGITGEVISEKNEVIRIKNISSLNIRVPHQVINCSKQIFPYLTNFNHIHNTLIISPPGAGKTTILRDLARQISKEYPHLNILILDERYEISASTLGESQLDVGQADVMLGCTKQMGFESGVRSMSPNIILTDEIATKQDISSILYANACGVNIIATVHAFTQKDLINKPYFKPILQKKVFKRFVVLSNRLGVGTIEGMYDENFKNLLKEKTYAVNT